MQDKVSGTNAYMTVKEMGALLGLKKVDSYWLVKKGHFRVISKAGKMWIERDSFEQWYSGQDHYHKVGDLTREDIRTDYYSVRDMMDLLDIGESTVYRIMEKDRIPAVRLFGGKRVRKENFWDWYDHQDRYHIPEEKLPVPPDRSAWIDITEMSRLLGISETESYGLMKDPAYKNLLRVNRLEGRDYISKKDFGRFLRKQSKYSYDPCRDPSVIWRGDRTCLTILQAGWYGKVTRSTVAEWCRQGRFPAKCAGKYVRIPLKEYREWLKQRQERSGHPNGIHTETGKEVLCDLQLQG